MTVYIASVHAGFSLKGVLKDFLTSEGYEVVDMGARILDTEDDYNEYVQEAAEAICHDKGSMGIVLGGSGQGEAMQANRNTGIRAAVYYGGNLEIVRLSREHNDANVLSLGARFLSEDEAKNAVSLWIKTHFSTQGRHQRRNEKLG